MSSERFHVGLVEIREQWTLDDLVQAHQVLDLYEAADRRELEKARRKR